MSANVGHTSSMLAATTSGRNSPTNAGLLPVLPGTTSSAGRPQRRATTSLGSTLTKIARIVSSEVKITNSHEKQA